MVFALPTCGGRRHERRERIRRRRQDPRTAMVSSGPILMRGKWTRIKGAAICSIQIYLHFFIISRWRSGLGDVFSTSHLGWGDVLADFLCHLRLIEILGVPLGTWFVQPLLQSRFASFNLWIVKKHAGYVDMKIECDSHGDTWNVQFPPTGADSFLASMSDAHTHTCSQPCWSVICLRSSLSDICFTHIYIYIHAIPLLASGRPTLPVHPESLPRSYPRDDHGEREAARRLREAVLQARDKDGRCMESSEQVWLFRSCSCSMFLSSFGILKQILVLCRVVGIGHKKRCNDM